MVERILLLTHMYNGPGIAIAGSRKPCDPYSSSIMFDQNCLEKVLMLKLVVGLC